MKISKVLIATDGSDRSDQAADYGISLAKACGAEINIISVVDSGHPRNAMDIDPDSIEEIKEDSGLTPQAEKMEEDKKGPEWQYVAKVSEAAHAAGLTVSCDVRIGDPAEQIVSFAQENGVDMIVLGSHGRSTVGAALMGSITTEVIHKCNIPVLVIPVHSS